MEVGRTIADLLKPDEHGLNLKETELCLGLPGGNEINEHIKITGKRGFSETIDLKLNLQSNDQSHLDELIKKDSLIEKSTLLCSKDPIKPPAKAQVVGWPPVRSFRKNIMAQKTNINEESENSKPCSLAFVKVSMDGAPYLRKVDLKMYKSYQGLSDSLAKMFSSFTMGKHIS